MPWWWLGATMTSWSLSQRAWSHRKAGPARTRHSPIEINDREKKTQTGPCRRSDPEFGAGWESVSDPANQGSAKQAMRQSPTSCRCNRPHTTWRRSSKPGNAHCVVGPHLALLSSPIGALHSTGLAWASTMMSSCSVHTRPCTRAPTLRIRIWGTLSGGRI